MIFNEWSYALFLIGGALGFALLPRAFRAAWLAIVGGAFYLFYGGPWLLIFIVEILLSRLYLPRSRWAIFGIVQATLILLVVKYGAFFSAVFAPVFGVTPISPLILPLGLSFFIFEFIHYATDRFRGKSEAIPTVEYASFILFFPTMIAGPIKRIQDFAPNLRTARVQAEDVWEGSFRIGVGIFKKSVFADGLNTWLQFAFEPNVPSEARYATIGFNLLVYSLRIYLDFSSYSDIAIGSARLFGIHVPENFNWPYLARNPSEFWRRWHISLSKWITDYVYVPLGGSRATKYRVMLNTVAAMTLSGLWHGAATNFIVWGLFHGLLLIAYRFAKPIWEKLVPNEAVREARPMRVCYSVANFSAVTFGWVFFAMPFSFGWKYAIRLLGGRWLGWV